MVAPWKQNSGDGKQGGEYKQPPAGNHPAVLVAMVDLGTQENEYQGKVTSQRRAMFVWELVTEKDENYPLGHDNYVVGIDLNVNIQNEKSKLRQWIEARKGKQFPANHDYDLTSELSQPCLLNVKLNAKGYPKVDGVSAVPKGMTVPPAKRKPFLWSIDEMPEDGSDPELPDWLPRLYGKRLAEVIANCVELSGGGNVPARATADADGDGDSESIPF